ncbi:HAD family hydrolase [Paucidesulfovibrio longus]|uniref:HAD family hydrolase n=1 Tax=Paucidesulfovibrio longus TaxID=889 RepID=UPI0003FE31FE|nr:HAD family hydrolase [Paucidesulfovibrio longus]
MGKIRAIIFDFDGTLAELTIDFDLMKRRVRALAAAFLGEEPEANGMPVLEWMAELAAEVEENEGRDMGLEFHSRARLVVNATELDAAREGRLFAFTEPLLAELAARGVGVGVITRNSTAAVRTVFPEIVRRCGVFLPREDARALKPDPAHVLQALERLGVEPGSALMVGDHGMDIAAGRAAGCRTAGVLSGNLGREALEAFHPDYIETDAEALVRRLAAEGRL